MEAGYTVTVAKADGTQSLQVTYSCMSYITRMYAKQTSSETLKELLKAMYEYSLAAKSYQNSL